MQFPHRAAPFIDTLSAPPAPLFLPDITTVSFFFGLQAGSAHWSFSYTDMGFGYGCPGNVCSSAARIALRIASASPKICESFSLYTCALLNMSSTEIRKSQTDAYPPAFFSDAEMDLKSTGLAISR